MFILKHNLTITHIIQTASVTGGHLYTCSDTDEAALKCMAHTVR